MPDQTTGQEEQDELRPEYKAAELEALLANGVRSKYVERYRRGTNLVKLASDVAAAFPTEQAVNDALHKVIASSNRAA